MDSGCEQLMLMSIKARSFKGGPIRMAVLFAVFTVFYVTCFSPILFLEDY